MKNILFIALISCTFCGFGQENVFLITSPTCAYCKAMKKELQEYSFSDSLNARKIEFDFFSITTRKAVEVFEQTYSFYPTGMNTGSHEFIDEVLLGKKTTPAIIYLNANTGERIYIPGFNKATEIMDLLFQD